ALMLLLLSGTHRAPPPFPTRRSSDLDEDIVAGFPNVIVIAIEHVVAGTAFDGVVAAPAKNDVVGIGADDHVVETASARIFDAARSEEHTSELQSREKSRMPSSA